MMIAFRRVGRRRTIVHGGAFAAASRDTMKEESHMKWETPEAIDFRFGMEITMYVANR
jgi:coenzyme PQQ precursor peptide PqqA